MAKRLTKLPRPRWASPLAVPDVPREAPWAHTHKVLNTALDLLQRFKGGDQLLDRLVTFGSERKVREGQHRQISYLQVGEANAESDLELRIEVFVVAKRRPWRRG